MSCHCTCLSHVHITPSFTHALSIYHIYTRKTPCYVSDPLWRCSTYCRHLYTPYSVAMATTCRTEGGKGCDGHVAVTARAILYLWPLHRCSICFLHLYIPLLSGNGSSMLLSLFLLHYHDIIYPPLSDSRRHSCVMIECYLHAYTTTCHHALTHISCSYLCFMHIETLCVSLSPVIVTCHATATKANIEHSYIIHTWTLAFLNATCTRERPEQHASYALSLSFTLTHRRSHSHSPETPKYACAVSANIVNKSKGNNWAKWILVYVIMRNRVDMHDETDNPQINLEVSLVSKETCSTA